VTCDAASPIAFGENRPLIGWHFNFALAPGHRCSFDLRCQCCMFPVRATQCGRQPRAPADAAASGRSLAALHARAPVQGGAEQPVI